MDKQIKFNYDWQLEDLESNVGKAFLWFCAINKVYPKVLSIPPINAGYNSQLLETRIDQTLKPGVFVLGVN